MAVSGAYLAPLTAADRQAIVEAAKAARMAYVMARPETGDMHIERIVQLAEGAGPHDSALPPGS
jgi:hypothetical protein